MSLVVCIRFRAFIRSFNNQNRIFLRQHKTDPFPWLTSFIKQTPLIMSYWDFFFKYADVFVCGSEWTHLSRVVRKCLRRAEIICLGHGKKIRMYKSILQWSIVFMSILAGTALEASKIIWGWGKEDPNIHTFYFSYKKKMGDFSPFIFPLSLFPFCPFLILSFYFKHGFYFEFYPSAFFYIYKWTKK